MVINWRKMGVDGLTLFDITLNLELFRFFQKDINNKIFSQDVVDIVLEVCIVLLTVKLLMTDHFELSYYMAHIKINLSYGH